MFRSWCVRGHRVYPYKDHMYVQTKKMLWVLLSRMWSFVFALVNVMSTDYCTLGYPFSLLLFLSPANDVPEI